MSPLDSYQNSELRRTQFSISYPVAVAAQQHPRVEALLSYSSRSYPYMLVEQVMNRLLPVPRYAKNRYQVQVEPDDPESEAAIVFALSPPWDRYRDIDDAVWHFARTCAGALLTFGEVSYEVAYYWVRRSGKVVAFDLVSLPPGSLATRDGQLVQHVPASAARELRVDREVVLDRGRVTTFTLPENVRGGWEQTIERLAVLSHAVPDFYLRPLGGASAGLHFDATAFFRAQDLALADATKLIGWDPSTRLFGGAESRIVEYYWILRTLRFEEFLIQIRQRILSGLNECFAQAGRLMRRQMRVDISGLPTLSDVREAEDHLFKGDIPVKSILAPFSI